MARTTTRLRPRTARRAASAVLLAVLAAAGTTPAAGQSARAQRAEAPTAVADARAREALALFLRSGVRQPYLATETTRQVSGRVRASEQVVKHAGPGRMRIEYKAPPLVRGEVVLIVGRRMFRYSPRQGKVLEGPLLGQEDIDARLRALLARARRGGVRIRSTGAETVAGRTATIVEIEAIRGARLTRRIWIDDKTGVRLKTEDRNVAGVIVSASEFTRVEMDPQLEPREMLPASLPRVPHEAILPSTEPLPTVEAAQRLVAYTIRQPQLPPAFELSGAWVVARPAARSTTILRYTNGISTVTLFQYPLAVPAWRQVEPPSAQPAPRLRGGGMMWQSGGRTYYLVGYLSPDVVDRLVASLR